MTDLDIFNPQKVREIVEKLEAEILTLRQDKVRLDKLEDILLNGGWELILLREGTLCATMHGYIPEPNEIIGKTLRGVVDDF